MLCPACSHAFRICYELDGAGRSTLFVYCGNSRCPSAKSNEGASGKDHVEAFNNLKKIVEDEMAERE